MNNIHSGMFISLAQEMIKELENKFYVEQLRETDLSRKKILMTEFDRFISGQSKVTRLLDKSAARIYRFIQSQVLREAAVDDLSDHQVGLELVSSSDDKKLLNY